MIFDCPDDFRRAIRVRAGIDDSAPTDVILQALERFLAKELDMVRKTPVPATEKPQPKRRRPRKPGGDQGG